MNKIQVMKRFQIGKVYRRDQPVMTRGRYREFYQCDFDIAGDYDPMLPDAEALKVISEILLAMPCGEFVIKLNDRRLLDGLFEVAGVPEDKFRTICSAVDKMDKLPWDEVKAEMVNVKGLANEAADAVGEYVRRAGEPRQLLSQLRSDPKLMANKNCSVALEQLTLLFDYLESYNCLQYVSFDLSLARGLDYYTGVIYEAVLVGKHVGSVCGGGRYDKLIGMYGKKDIPAVGFSVGLERLFAIMEDEMRKRTHGCETAVMVCAADKNRLADRMKLVELLWSNGIAAETLPRANPKIQSQLSYANERNVPFAVVIGGSELERGVVQLKDLNSTDDERKQVEVPRDQLVEVLKQRGVVAKQ
jgi:histidyl-tRNA synthetase